MGLFIIFLGLTLSFAQAGDVIQSVNETIADVGGDLYQAVYGSCAETVRRTCEAQTGNALPQLSDLLPAMEQVNDEAIRTSVDRFFARAKDEQIGILSCERTRLRAILGSVPGRVAPSPTLRDQGDAFVKTMMTDICQKIPELRTNYQRFRGIDRQTAPIDEELNRLAGRLLPTGTNINAWYPPSATEEASIRAQMATLTQRRESFREVRRSSYERFLQVQASVWKGANTEMETYLLSMMEGRDEPDACVGSRSDADGASSRLRFKDTVVLGMIRQGMEDSTSISNLSTRGRALLVERSDLGVELQSVAGNGNYQAQLALCRINAETRGTEALQQAGDYGSLLLGGLGLALRGARIASLGVQGITRMMAASRVALLASSAVGTASAARGINASCFNGIPENFYSGQNESCEMGPEGWAQEIRINEAENCALAVAIGAAEVAGGLGDWLQLFRRGPGALRAADQAAAQSIVREQRLADLRSPPSEIIVTGTRRTTRPPPQRTPAEEAAAQANREAREQRELIELGNDRDLLVSEVRGRLRGFSDDVDGDFLLVEAGRFDELAAKYPNLSSADLDDLRSLQGALGRNTTAIAGRAIPLQPTPEMIRRAGLSPDERAREVGELLGITLTDSQRRALEAAHLHGRGPGVGFYNYPPEVIFQKGLILREGGFTAAQIRPLFDGYVGDVAVSARPGFFARLFGGGSKSAPPLPANAREIFKTTGEEVTDAQRLSPEVSRPAGFRSQDLFAPRFTGTMDEMIRTGAWRDDQLYQGNRGFWWTDAEIPGAESLDPLIKDLALRVGGPQNVRRLVSWPNRQTEATAAALSRRDVALDSYRVVANQVRNSSGQWVDDTIEVIARDPATGEYVPMLYVRQGDEMVPARTFEGQPILQACIKCHHRPPSKTVFTPFPFASVRIPSKLSHGYKPFARPMVEAAGDSFLPAAGRINPATPIRDLSAGDRFKLADSILPNRGILGDTVDPVLRRAINRAATAPREEVGSILRYGMNPEELARWRASNTGEPPRILSDEDVARLVQGGYAP